ncbi:Uncharacterised protein [Vibrio cholerae]|nr:Uncharacterised protein [Vibrio cholerae]
MLVARGGKRFLNPCLMANLKCCTKNWSAKNTSN